MLPIQKFQIINGGLLGTGLNNLNIWKIIFENFKISKVIVLYLGDDLRRSILNFDRKNIECLSDSEKCEGDENFYGFPLRTREPSQFLKNLKILGQNTLKKKFLKKCKKKNVFFCFYIIKLPKNFLKINL